MIPGRSTYVRLSSFYFLYYAFLGVMMPYWSLYLQAVGLDATAIGVVLAGFAALTALAGALTAVRSATVRDGMNQWKKNQRASQAGHPVSWTPYSSVAPRPTPRPASPDRQAE